MPTQLYARIHPDARNGSTPTRLYDVAGVQFIRGGGSYKGWYPINDEQAEVLRRCHVTNGNPNSMRVFQIEETARVDEISAAEARSRMAPEQRRLDQARDVEIASLKRQLAAIEPLLKLLGNPDALHRLATLAAVDKAASGQHMSADEGDVAAAVATAPPRRAAMTEMDIEGDEKRAASTPAVPARTEAKPAPPAPPARPGARPGSGGSKKDDAKKDAKKDEPKPVPNSASAIPASLPPALPSDISAAMDAGAIDEDDDHDV